MKFKLFLLTFAGISLFTGINAQKIKVNEKFLIGIYKVTSIKITHEVDLNKDGKKSSELFDEYNDCQKEYTIEFLEEHKAILKAKSHNCKEDGGEYTWEIKNMPVEEKEYHNGSMTSKMVDKTFLLFNTKRKHAEMVPFQILAVSSKSLRLLGMVSGSSDTTDEGIYTFEKTGKKN